MLAHLAGLLPLVLTAGRLLQTGGLLETPLGTALLAVAAVGVVVLVGRLLLRIAWRVVTIAAVVVGALFVVTTVLGGA